MLVYRIELTPDDNDTLLVTCPAVPEVVTFGDDQEDAVLHAVDALEEAIACRMAGGEDIPDPYDPAKEPSDGVLVRVPLLTSLKVLLYVGCRAAGVTRAELARRLGWHREQVDRLFRLGHASRLDQLEAAFEAIGKTIDVEVREAA